MQILKKISSHPALIFAEDLQKICEPLKQLNIPYFSHVQIDAQGKFSALGLFPEFVKLYLEKEYYRYDIHMAKSRMNEQYILWDAIKLKNESKDLSDDFKSFSLDHTFTIMQKNNNCKNYFHFSGKLGCPSINDTYLQNIDLLKKFIFHFYDKIHSHKDLKKGLDIKFEIPKENSGYLVEKVTANIDVHNFLANLDLDRIYMDSSNYITKREFECLHWLSLGKTIEQVALILNISPRTVKLHIKNIKEKFGCNNQFQLGLIYSKLNALSSR